MLYFSIIKSWNNLPPQNECYRQKSLQQPKGVQESLASRVMSPKRWILLLIFYISYLMFGASIYYHIQHGVEKIQREDKLRERIEINEYLVDQLADKNETTQTQILDKITNYCGKPVTNYTTDEYEIPYTWTFYHSFFFAFTVCSTVGYGNISPTTFAGRLIMIFYSIIGIPVNGILFAGLGEYFGKTFEAIYRRYKKYKLSRDKHYVPPQLGLVTIISIALIPGIAVFIFLPAVVFTYFEKWDYSISVYYAYVTTTTIGFGDYVPTFQSNQPREFGGWFVVYEIFIIFWFIFSLGYLVMIMTFITRGLQSKKLSRLEQQLSTNIKTTQNRIWTGVTKDVGYLRRILNELYVMKVKPVYTEPDPAQFLHRSNSCPELTMYRVEPPPEFARKRAFSECYDTIEARNALTTFHAASDTELDKLDKQKSFQNAEAFRQNTELLAKVVTALGTVRAPQPEEDDASLFGAYHGFSDSQILASEWSYPSITAPPHPRGRACSDFNLAPNWQLRRPTAQPNEWTWSGDNNQIQEAINNRYRQDKGADLYRSSFGIPPPPHDYIVNMEDEELRKPRAKKFSMPDGLRKIFPFKKRLSQETMGASNAPAAVTASVGNGGAYPHRKFSIMSVPDTQQHRTPPLDYYSTVTAGASPSYFVNGSAQTGPGALPTGTTFPSDGCLVTKPGKAGSLALNGGTDIRRGSTTGDAYQRNAVGGARKRRESIFTPNPALATRRASMFPASNAAGLTQRRGSLFGTGAATASNISNALPARRGSLYQGAPRIPSAANERRPSLFSVASQEDREVLENTTIADLIRALEAVHTQAVLDEAAASPAVITHNDLGGIFGSDAKKQRKAGNVGLDPPELPPLLSLFSGDNSRALSAAAANRLYARRSTVVGTLPSTSFNTGSSGTGASSAMLPATNISVGPTSILTRRRKSSAVQIAEPPPSYSERDTNTSSTTSSSTPISAISKFKRRFSVRPTTLQIPPGKAPPPGVGINSAVQQQTSATAPMITPTAAPSTMQQRRLSLRPSPLARELNCSTTSSSTSSSGDPSPTSPTPSNTTLTSTTRLLPLNSSATVTTPTTSGNGLGAGTSGRPPITASTHSPLSRIVQITQAQRKSSMPEGFPLERTKKPDSKP